MPLEYWLGYIVAGVAVGLTLFFLQLLIDIHKRIGVAETNIENSHEEFQKLNTRLKDIDKNIEKINGRLSRVEQRIEDLPQLLATTIEKELTDFENKIIKGDANG